LRLSPNDVLDNDSLSPNLLKTYVRYKHNEPVWCVDRGLQQTELYFKNDWQLPFYIRKALVAQNSALQKDLYIFGIDDISTQTIKQEGLVRLKFNRKEKRDFKDLITDLSNYLLSAKIIKQVVDTIKSVPTVEEELSFTYVLHKITEVGDSISENTIQKIDKEADAVNKYIKTVNSVNIKAVDSVTRLFHEMNNLQEKSLNKFADAIANKLTVALNNLSKEINDADKSLAKADELREKRINAINKSIEKIQNIMSKTINIRVNGSVDDAEIDEDPKG
jgi:hypothetical protein